MFVIRFAYSPFGAIAATSFALAMLPGAGYAYTADQEQACTGDAFRLCSADIPDVDRITACMIRNKAQLSPGCQVFFRAGPEPEPGAAAPIDIKPAAVRKSAAKPHRIKKRPKPAAT
ncbi:MAG TPA: hypothetical protein VNS33_08740 [Bradyrhizobium sp.]|nr:hypothetical protein [Bradyrhizobium sp.]